MATEFHLAGENRRLEWKVLIDKPGRTGPGPNRFVALRLLEVGQVSVVMLGVVIRELVANSPKNPSHHIWNRRAGHVKTTPCTLAW